MSPTQTLPPAADLPGWAHLATGKVRDLYVPDGTAGPGAAGAAGPGAVATELGASGLSAADVILMVASDRISAYDWLLTPGITDKGKILTALSTWWFDELADLVPGHVVAESDLPPGVTVPAEVAGRAVVCRRLEMFPIECVARGYLTGSGLVDYRATGAVGGHRLPAGLEDGSRLAPAIYTPATKAAIGDHDENIDYARTVELLGESDAQALRELTLELYTRAEEIARERDIILADTKFEFGRDPRTGEIVLADEVLTPDSSRFWDAAGYRVGRPQPSFDKQFVRDWLTSPASGWDRDSGQAPPRLPDEIVERTRARYLEAYERLTGEQPAL